MKFVYNLWRYRNDVKLSNRLYSEEIFLQKICWEVKTRIVGEGKFKESEENDAFCTNWGIFFKVLV